ncbi:MAG: CBS domain-containing protein [Deltaproteobacteria bacterium]|nr:MAG: CBS domain-containing protein [Deltaproteobacteria bacterium]
MATVQEYMSKDVIVLEPTQMLYHAFATMELYHLRHIPVVDKHEVLVGILSDRDLKKAMNSHFSEEKQDFVDAVMLTPIEDIMTKDVITTTPGADVAGVARQMLSNKISSIVVVKEGETRPVGIITDTDLLRLMVTLLPGG